MNSFLAGRAKTPSIKRIKILPPMRVDTRSVQSYIKTRFADNVITKEQRIIVETKNVINIDSLITKIAGILSVSPSKVEVEKIDPKSETASWVRNFLGDIKDNFSYILVDENNAFIIDHKGNFLKISI